MMVVSALDLWLVEESVKSKELISVQLPNTRKPMYAVFIDPETFRNNKWNYLGFTITKNYNWLKSIREADLNDILHGDRIIRITEGTGNKFKTIMFIITSSFYEKRIGRKLFSGEK